MKNEYVLNTALRQSAVDLSCDAGDFLSEKNKVVISEKNDRARKYLELPFDCNLVSYGNNIVASVRSDVKKTVSDYIDKYPIEHCFETPNMNVLSDALSDFGLKICFMAEYFLPDLNVLKRLPCVYETRILTQTDFEALYRPEWNNALCEKRRELDVLGVGAYDNGRLIGLAGCSADCEDMYQIGIDVLPEYRRQGIASALTSALALEIISRGKVPFYCAAWSNIKSVRNAVRSGFRPAWVEMTAKPTAFVDEMNGIVRSLDFAGAVMYNFYIVYNLRKDGYFMEENKKVLPFNLIGAVLCALYALMYIIYYGGAMFHMSFIYSLTTILHFAAYAGLAVSLFMKRRDILTIVSAVLVLLSLISIWNNLSLAFSGRFGVSTFFFGLIPNLLRLLCFIGVFALTASPLYANEYFDKIKKLWYVPIICIGAAAFLTIIRAPGSIMLQLFNTAVIVFTLLWLVNPDGKISVPEQNVQTAPPASRPVTNNQDSYCNLAVHVLLLLFTFGIWYYIWIYRTTRYLNCIEDEPPRNPVTKLLLCMFVPFYLIYWVYKSAQRIDKLALSKGVSSDLSVLCLILAIFVSIIPPILMQDKMNAIVNAGQTAPQRPAPAPQTGTASGIDVPDELKKYKELLDSGVITQEEFDAKKKQLLNL